MPESDEYKALRRQRRQQRKQDFMRDKSCVECGSRENLEIDHIDPASKAMEPNRIWFFGDPAKRQAELDKCQVLCRPCHLVKTARTPRKKRRKFTRDLKHGDYGYYVNRKCRCDLCKAANNAFYMELYWRRKKLLDA